jgi:hypothetical protein
MLGSAGPVKTIRNGAGFKARIAPGAFPPGIHRRLQKLLWPKKLTLTVNAVVAVKQRLMSFSEAAIKIGLDAMLIGDILQRHEPLLAVELFEFFGHCLIWKKDGAFT